MACTTTTEMQGSPGEMFDGKTHCIMYRSSRNMRVSVSAVGNMFYEVHVDVADHNIIRPHSSCLAR